jgi:hypothetical protein
MDSREKLDIVQIANQISDTIKKVSKPLSKDQRLALVGAVSVWALKIEQASRAQAIEECIVYLQAIVNCDARDTHKEDQCLHGQYGYEHCEACISDYAENAIKKLKEQP